MLYYGGPSVEDAKKVVAIAKRIVKESKSHCSHVE